MSEKEPKIIQTVTKIIPQVTEFNYENKIYVANLYDNGNLEFAITPFGAAVYEKWSWHSIPALKNRKIKKFSVDFFSAEKENYYYIERTVYIAVCDRGKLWFEWCGSFDPKHIVLHFKWRQIPKHLCENLNNPYE